MILFLLLLLVTQIETSIKTITIRSDARVAHQPVSVDLPPGSIDPHAPICLNETGGKAFSPGQIETKADGRQRLWWIADLSEGSTVTYELVTDQNCNEGSSFYWTRSRNDATRLMLGDNPVIQYEHPVFDMENIDGTSKPFHHVFDPVGSGLITKGSGGRYTHHRGIFYGYYLFTGEDRKEKVNDRDERINIWASFDGERAEHKRVIKEFSGPVMGGHVLEISWKDHDGKTLIQEIREIRVFKQPRGETLIDFSSQLRPTSGPVKLSGNAHHGGVQYRAAQYVADNPESTRFIRPEQWSHLPADAENRGEENLHILPWDAMHHHIGDRMYTTSFLTHPDNPGKGEMGERKYGRFGYYFPHDLTEDNPLNVNYRFWITAGEAPEREDIDKRYRVFASPPTVIIEN